MGDWTSWLTSMPFDRIDQIIISPAYRVYLINSAGQGGPTSKFIYERKEHLDAQSFGDALFASESFDEWAQHMSVNVSSIYFVSVAFLGLLGKGAQASKRMTSIINITSISGIGKVTQDHVTPLL